MTSDFTYFPYVRTGLSSAVTTADDANAGPFVGLDVHAVVNGTAASSVKLRLAGPGEIRAVDVTTVVRTDPPAGAMGVASSMFPAVELQPADLPWMFTPVAPTGARLRPWLCLVCTELAETGEPVVDATRPLPVLHVGSPATMLPDPAESWAWAHVAAAGETDAAGLETLVTQHPGQVVARLVCPRRLRPERRYLAAIVPVYEGGRVAGLGGTPDESATVKLGHAWRVDAGAPPVDLPVYFSWQFHTGVGGDFRSLALRLRGRPLPAGAGSRPMDIRTPGDAAVDLPAAAVTDTLGMEGALQPDGFIPTAWDATERARFTSGMATLIDAANTPAAGLGPPLWGRWPAAESALPATAGWLAELNSDPRHRAAAGLGARVVQDQREELLAQAWAQVGEVQRANQRLRQAQLARAQGKSLYLDALPRLTDGAFLALSRPLHDRVLVARGTSAFGEVTKSAVPERLLDGAARRIARPRGPLGRRLGIVPGQIVEKAAAGTVAAAPPVHAPSGSRPIAAAFELLRVDALTMRTGTAGFAPLSDWQKFPSQRRDAGPDSQVMSDFRAQLVAYETWRRSTRRKPERRPRLDPASLRQRIMASTDPDDTVVRRTAAVVTAPRWDGAGDPLEPIMAAPSFPQPMIEPLAAMSQELVVPGLEGIPAETVTAAVPNNRFIAAYMVGLNHEVARQLLFNEYPTDQRGTYFRQFWDARGRVPAPPPGSTPDIGPIDGWAAANDLGADVTGHPAGLLVVIVRGELLRRYADAALYATPATWVPPANAGEPYRRDLKPNAAPKFPVLRGRLEPDLVYFGLDLTADDARGDEPTTSGSGRPGWFIVFEQSPVRPHFGLEEPTGAAGSTPAAWDRVTWGDVTPATTDPAQPRAGTFVPVTAPSWWTAWPAAPAPLWGASSATMAAITLQRPTRLALHASDVLP